MDSKVQIKGIRDGLLVSLGEGNWDEVHRSLLEHLDAQGNFLKGARLTLDVGNQNLKAVDLGALSKELSDRELTLWAVVSTSPTTERSAQSFGLATRLPAHKKPEPEGKSMPDVTPHSGDNAIMVRRTLRSGVSLQHIGHVIVIGDVNPGAEIIASGNVLVWGKLRGVVHAGAEGDEQAIVCALDLSPTQLRIAGKISITPRRGGKPQPEMARLKDGQVVAETWNPKRENL